MRYAGLEGDEEIFRNENNVMKINLLAFGIARDILHSRKLEFELSERDSIAVLKHKLHLQYPEFEKLKSLAFAVGDEYREETYELKEGDEVAIIPPVSGG